MFVSEVGMAAADVAMFHGATIWVIAEADVRLARRAFDNVDPEDRCLSIQAPREGFEPSTRRLTAGCSTVELSRNHSSSVRPERSGLNHGALTERSHSVRVL